MIFKIAYRNLMRNKRRSLIVLSSIIVGVASLLLSESLMKGMGYQLLNSNIENYVSEMQIHKKGYKENAAIETNITDTKEIENLLNKFTFVQKYSKRLEIFGLVSSPATSTGVQIAGIEPDNEIGLILLSDIIIEGKYLSGIKGEVVISQKMADKLEVELGDKLVAVANDTTGNISNALFRITGIFSSASSEFDKTSIFVNIKDLQEMMNLPNAITSIAMITKNRDKITEYKNKIQVGLHKDLEIFTYIEMIPIIYNYVAMFDQSIYLLYLIIISAVLFGIINAMLMSVFERIQEIGVLMSIGMKKIKIFNMIIVESFVLGVVGTFFGFLLGYLIYLPLAKYGWDLSTMADGLNAFGMGSVLKARMDIVSFLNSILLMPIGAVIGAIYPAYKAVKLLPTDAMRYV